jgi:RNA polymerase sigma-70 factor (ECF subfamily)
MIGALSIPEIPATAGRTTSLAFFEDLLVAHQPRLLSYIKSLVPNHHEAEDLLQRTNLILWRKRVSFKTGSNFLAWSFAIARLEACNQLRQLRRDQRVFADREEDAPATEWPRPMEEEIVDPEALLALRDCLERLPSRDLELVLMRYGTDKTLGDYARELNRRPGTLKARLFKIREHLRKCIEDELRGKERAGQAAVATSPPKREPGSCFTAATSAARAVSAVSAIVTARRRAPARA